MIHLVIKNVTAIWGCLLSLYSMHSANEPFLAIVGNGRANDRNKKQRKAETGIKIFVPDYSNRTPDL